MRKLIYAMALVSLAAAGAARAQESSVDDRTQRSYNILISQYATASFGFYIEQRCRQLAESAYLVYAQDQQLLNNFMLIMMGEEANTKLLVDIQTTAKDAEMNPCDSKTFRFSLNTSQVASQLATRVKLLSDEEVARLTDAMTRPVQPGGQTPAETPQQSQSEAPAQTPAETPQQSQSEAPAQTPPATPPPATNEPAADAVTPLEFLPATQIERQPENKKPPATQTPTTQPQPTARQTNAPAGILLANYVNPYPYTPAAPPPGETEKDMGRRHRQELIDLRSAHRGEMDAFKDNKDKYAAPDAVKDAIKARQDQEFDDLRNRHRAEEERY